MNDIPFAGLPAKLTTEVSVGVLCLCQIATIGGVRFVLSCLCSGVRFFRRINVECILDNRVGFLIGGTLKGLQGLLHVHALVIDDVHGFVLGRVRGVLLLIEDHTLLRLVLLGGLLRGGRHIDVVALVF